MNPREQIIPRRFFMRASSVFLYQNSGGMAMTAFRPFGLTWRGLRRYENRYMLNFPMGNGAIAVAADRIIFAVSELQGNISLAKPKKP
jgi:hypothetical protein